MINWRLFFTLSCLFRFQGLRIISMVLIIIVIRLIIASVAYWKFRTLLALLWILIYLGGIMVVFVYVLFTVDEEASSRPLGGEFSCSGLVVTWFIISTIIFCLKMTLGRFDKPLAFENISSTYLITYSERYLQIVAQSPIFFFSLSISIILFALIQILSMINLKGTFRRSYLL